MIATTAVLALFMQMPPGEEMTRIDQKRPYVRVWYWPPNPEVQEDETPSLAVKGTPAPTELLLDNVNFPTNRSAVVDESKQLQILGDILKQNPNMRVKLTGHTDIRGSRKRNAKLALDRAKAVREVLVEGGVDASQLEVHGAGESMPLSGATTGETYWLSRRVTIEVQTHHGDIPPAR